MLATFMLLLDMISTGQVINIKKPETFVKVNVMNLEMILKTFPLQKKNLKMTPLLDITTA